MEQLKQSFSIAAAVCGKPEPVMIPWSVLRFPGGELHVSVGEFCFDARVESVSIRANLRSSEAVMALLMLTDALRRRMSPRELLFLELPYVPYARQDRVAVAGEALSIKVFCNLINSQGYDSVIITDPHSDVTAALLNNVQIVDASCFVSRVLQSPVFAGGVAFVAPDAGARKRVMSLAKRMKVAQVVMAEKVRDVRTGEITGTAVENVPVDVPLLVVDDICDGGKTFIELAKALRKQTTQDLYLYVSHGIFSKGIEALTPYFKQVFTPSDWTNSTNSALVRI